MKWLKEPLFHFLALGALIFGWYAYLSPNQPDDDEILVTRGKQEHIVTAFSRTWQRPPTQEEFVNLVDDWIKEEIAYREGLRMGLDVDDTIIRRRLRQKLEMLAEDIVSAVEPGEAELEQYLEEHQSDYLLEPRYTLQHIYFSRDRRGSEAATDAEQALLLLRNDQQPADPVDLGDPLPLPRRFVRERESALTAQLGGEFTAGLESMETGRWQGPIRSGFGLHLVLIEEFIPGRPLTLEEARPELQRDWANEQRIQSLDALYGRLRERYTVHVESLAAGEAAP